MTVAITPLIAFGCASDSADSGERGTSPDTSDEAGLETGEGSGAEDGAADGTAAPATSPPPSTAFVEVVEQPGLAQDDFVGARNDVEITRCESDGGDWAAEGTVSNPTEVGAAYRIYVAFNEPDSATTRGLVEVGVGVEPGESEPWQVSAPIADLDLECILRVERVERRL